MPKSFAAMCVFLLCVSGVASAQKRVQIGAFLDYLSSSATSTQPSANNFGIGGRLGYRVHRRVVLEGEFAYDYGANFTAAYNNIKNLNGTALENTTVGLTQGWIGPALQRVHGKLRPFVTLKGGFMDFRLSSSLATSLIPYGTELGIALHVKTSNVNPAIYPAAGGELGLGPIGLRLEVGDAIFFDSGGHNDLRLTFGPTLSF